MTQEIAHLVDGYLAWLKEKTAVKQLGQWTEITTPFVDRHNDMLQIYAKSSEGEITLTDDGYIIHDLENSGCQLNTPKRKALLRTILNGFGVDLVDDQLLVKATRNNFSLMKHNLLQAMLSVNDLFSLAGSSVASLFFEDVEKWLDENHVRYTPSVKLTGKSRYDHYFDFVIPRSGTSPERVLQVVTSPNRNAVESFAWAWIDTKENRRAETHAFAMLNDKNPVPAPVLSALKSYEVTPIIWSQRDAYLPALVA